MPYLKTLKGNVRFFDLIRLLRSESPSGMCAKLRTVAASNIEIMRRNHSSIACSRHIYVVLFFAPIQFVVNHIFNAKPTGRLQQHPLLFTTNNTDCTLFLWRLHTARLPYPGHRIILLRSESLSSMCAKLRIAAASNNRDHAPQSLYHCLFAPRIYGCYSSRTSRSWWITYLTQRQRRGCNTLNLSRSGSIDLVLEGLRLELASLPEY